MAEVVFHDIRMNWFLPDVQLFGVWNDNEAGPKDEPYYSTYRKVAKFLVEKYGNSILYDLYHEAAVNRQALENVLGKKGLTLSSLEAEFAAWCDRPKNTNEGVETLIDINNVSLTGQAGVWLTSELPSGKNLPVIAAIQSGTIRDNKQITFSLVYPRNNKWNAGPPWRESGDYYVYFVPIVNQSYQWNDALVYSDESNTPIKVTFNKGSANLTSLSFENFKEI
jgi:hypothetical protein